MSLFSLYTLAISEKLDHFSLGPTSPSARYTPNVPVYKMIVPTSSTECYSFLLENNLASGRPTFLAGASGAGKTMLAAHVSACANFVQHRLPSSTA